MSGPEATPAQVGASRRGGNRPCLVGHGPGPGVRGAVHGRPRPVDRERRASRRCSATSASPRRGCNGWSTPMPSPSAASCSSGAGPRTSSAAGASSCSASCLFAGRQPGVRHRPEPVHAGRGPRPAGPRRGGACPRPRLTILTMTFRAPAGAVACPRDLECDGRGGGRLGGAARRRPHRPAVVAVDLLHQPPHRRRRPGGGPGRAGRDPRRGRAPVARRPRRRRS